MKKLFKVQSSKFKVHGSKLKDLEPGTWNLEHAATAWALGAALAFMPTVAAAQITTDPTRPATGFVAEAPEGATAGNQLQSVMISPTRSAAIINGVRVSLGEKYGDAVLVRVAESEVVLKSGNEQQVLKLYPGVEKRESVPVALATPVPAPEPAAKSAPRKAKAKARRDAKPPADEDAPARQEARP